MDCADRFGQNLRRCRRVANLSQEQLGLRAGLHRTEIGLLERGARVPRIDTLLKLAAALSVEPGELNRRDRLGARRGTAGSLQAAFRPELITGGPWVVIDGAAASTLLRTDPQDIDHLNLKIDFPNNAVPISAYVDPVAAAPRLSQGLGFYWPRPQLETFEKLDYVLIGGPVVSFKTPEIFPRNGRSRYPPAPLFPLSSFSSSTPQWTSPSFTCWRDFASLAASLGSELIPSEMGAFLRDWRKKSERDQSSSRSNCRSRSSRPWRVAT